jgi:tRNA(His) 5'-end guanylyltransferase
MLKHRQDDMLNPKYYKGGMPKLAQFDARAWLLSKEELINCLIWRQQDCERNSVSGMAQSLYSHKMLHNKDQSKMLEMIEASGKNWHTLPNHLKHGMFSFKESYTKKDQLGQPVIRTRWVLDLEAPRITENRAYFEEKLNNIA